MKNAVKEKTEEQPILTWDTCDIAQGQAEYLMEQAKEEGEELTEDEAFNQACGDSMLYQMEWDDMTDELTEAMKAFNPDGVWYCEVNNFGWRGMNGHKFFDANSGAELLEAVLPKTDCTFWVYRREDCIAINNCHHDSPVRGGLWGVVLKVSLISSKTIKQSSLTAECWTVQMWGTDKCNECPVKGKRDCGGKNILKTGKNANGIKVGVAGASGQPSR